PCRSLSRTTPVTRSLLSLSHLHHRGTDHPSAELVTGAHLVEHDDLVAFALCVHHRFVQLGVEGTMERLDALQPFTFQHFEQLAVNHLDTADHRLVVLGPVCSHQGQLEVV